MKGQDNVQNTTVNINLNSSTKFPLNNHQSSKALKFNRQPLKLKKVTVNRQSYHPIETLVEPRQLRYKFKFVRVVFVFSAVASDSAPAGPT